MSFNAGDTVQHITADPKHPAKANGGYAVVMYVTHDQLQAWIKTMPGAAIYVVPASEISAAAGKTGPVPFAPTFPFNPGVY